MPAAPCRGRSSAGGGEAKMVQTEAAHGKA
jgi:hypothetical protein